MALLYNLAKMTTATTGTGTITLGSAAPGFLTFAGAGVTNGQVVSYGIQDGTNSEVGIGTYTSSGTTLTRTVTNSTNSGSPINLSGNAFVYITARSADILNPTLTTEQTLAGKLTTVASATGGAGFNLPQGTAPSSPTNGDMWTTSSGLFARIAGSTVGPFGASSIVLLQTLTASSSASLASTTALTSAYDMYMIVVNSIVPATNNASFRMQISTDGGSSYANTDYSTTSGAAGFWVLSLYGNSELTISNNAASGGISGVYFLSNVNSTSRYKTLVGIGTGYFTSTSVGSTAFDVIAGGWSGSTSAINAIQFIMSSGNIGSGTVSIYGVKQS